eukprot:3786835-Pyramimonas_sp.AAC.1
MAPPVVPAAVADDIEEHPAHSVDAGTTLVGEVLPSHHSSGASHGHSTHGHSSHHGHSSRGRAHATVTDADKRQHNATHGHADAHAGV